MKDEPTARYNDSALAERLWPVYLATGGNASETRRRAAAAGIRISKPTLDKLIDWFGFRDRLASAQQSQFSAAVDHSGELEALLAEITQRKTGVQKSLEASPDDLKLHRLYGDYIGKILEVRRQMIAARQVDREQLMIEAIKAVVRYLSDRGHEAAAAFIGEHLEPIAAEIKERWR